MVLRYSDTYRKTVPLNNFLTIGKALDNDLVLDGDDIANVHARIERKGDQYRIFDLNSSSGTFVNGTKVKEAVLKIGDKISLGHFGFDVESKDEVLKSRSPHWQAQLAKIPTFAKTDLPVLLLGPSGVGKEVLSRCIHFKSQRMTGPLVTVNCSALTESLAESELFGHVKGSFTGATQDRKGAFETAKYGTLVLDEIGDLPITLQPKLLRALDNKEIKPVGSDETIVTNVRIIACTHQDLKAKVEAGQFRLDLFYRLNIVQINIPPLQERMEDFEEILLSLCKEQRLRVHPNAIHELKNHSWPGNIRELKNLVLRLKAIHGDDYVKRDDISEVLEIKTYKSELCGTVDIPTRRGSKRSNLIREIERQVIVKQLLINGGNQRQTAMDLGMPKSTLSDKIKAYKVDVDKYLREHFENKKIVVGPLT